jgi:hypothetical protein
MLLLREMDRYKPFCFVALLFLTLAVFLAYHAWYVITTSAETQGTQVLTCTDDGDDGCSVGADTSYQVNGQTYDIGAWPFMLNSPESVTVLYDPQHPDQGVVYSFTNLWAGSFA